MTFLESTGAVDSAALYDPTPLVLTSDSDGIDMVVALTLVPPVAAIAIFLLWLAAGRNKRRTEGPHRSYQPQDDDRRDSDRRRGGGTRVLADRQRAR